MLSVNGFRGVVTLEVLGLPAGVTSQTATSVTIDGSPHCCIQGAIGTDTPLSLKASAAAALGSSTITVRATSGSLVHTLALPILVVDRLPPSTAGAVDVELTVAGGTTSPGRVFLSPRRRRVAPSSR